VEACRWLGPTADVAALLRLVPTIVSLADGRPPSRGRREALGLFAFPLHALQLLGLPGRLNPGSPREVA
jgi:hypothetical protein